MGNGISSVVFSIRSGGKAVNGDKGRTAICAAQAGNAVEAYAQTGFAGSKAAGQAVSYVDNLAKTETIWGKGAKCFKWVQTHINPMIGIFTAIKIAVADDKEKAFCVEVPGFMGMVAAENAFKKLQKTDAAKNLLKGISNKCGSKGKICAAVVEGLGFAAASIGGYMIASKAGEYAIEGERALRAKKALNINA